MPLQWLGRPNLALVAITIVHAWRILPFAVVIFIAGRASIPTEVEDAAKIDGATGLKKLWYVDVPLQLPIALIAILFGIVFTAADFAVVYILTHGGPFNSTQVLPTWAFAIGIHSGVLGEGAAISLYLFPLLVVVTVRCCSSRDGCRSRNDAGAERLDTYLVVGPFAIFLAFPFYFVLVRCSRRTTTSRPQHAYTHNDPRVTSMGLLELRDDRARPVPVRGHELPDAGSGTRCSSASPSS